MAEVPTCSQAVQQGSRSSYFQGRLLRPHCSRPALGVGRRRAQVRVRAATGNATPAAPDPQKEAKNIIVKDIPTGRDTESFTDLMAFTGSAPERANGRVAMWAFLFLVLAERGEHLGVLEQAQKHPFAAISTSLYIGIATIIPKIISGRPLADLHAAASREGLPPNLKFFNKTHEIWVGRVAMVGCAGLLAVELLLKGGEPLFG